MPESIIQPSDGSSDELRYTRTLFFNGGRNGFINPPAQDEDGFLTYENLMPPVKGTLEYRWGTSTLVGDCANFARNLTPALISTGKSRVIMACSDKTGSASSTNKVTSVKVDGIPATSTATVFTPAANAVNPRAVVSRDWAFFQDGTAGGSRKWQIDSSPAAIANMNSWGILPPVWGSTPDAAPLGAGAITLVTGRTYYIIYVNENTGHASDLGVTSVGGPIGYADSGPATDNEILVSGLPVSPPADPAIGSGTQITHMYLLATSDGGGSETLYYVTKWALGSFPATYLDNLPETADSGASLLTNSIFQETGSDGVARGVIGNARPPVPTALPNTDVFPQIVKHRGRIFIPVGSTLYFSKSLADLVTSTNTSNIGRYEECFPPEYQIDVSPSGAENIRGLLSDGQNLYIATQSRIYVLQGEGPEDFAIPQAIHNGVGVSYPDTWQIVYVDNQPVGSIWLTPDNRIILSDFNTNVDIGEPVQDILNLINPSYFNQSFGCYMGKGVYQFYVLFICYNAQTAPQLALVFDLKGKRWATWDFTLSSESFGAGLNFVSPIDGKPYLIMSSVSDGILAQFNDAVLTDFGHAFNCTFRTTWMPLGSHQTRKALNAMRFLGSKDSGNVASVAVYGAESVASFPSPTTLITGATPSNSPISSETDQVLPLATKFSNFRYFSLQCILSPISTSLRSLLTGYELDFTHLDKF